jgi:hypothetical protein
MLYPLPIKDIRSKLLPFKLFRDRIRGMEKAKKLREIAGCLTQLESLNESKADAAKNIRRKVLKPLFENWPLIARAKVAYSLHWGCAELFIMLENTASQWRTKDLGICTELDLRFSKRQTGGAKHPSFIDELNRWANELEKDETKQNTTPAKVINIGNFKGVLGDVQAENVQTGDRASIHKQPTKGGFLKIAKRFLDWVLKLWPK